MENTENPDSALDGRPDSLLPYDAWANDALRQVAVRALAYAAAHGLPGEHHFYVSFRTSYPGVSMPQRLLAQYPDDMTIVLQHQFWDPKVSEDEGWFSVGLSFGNIPATLVIPFAALTSFIDPHVQFGLHFTPPEQAANDEPEASPGVSAEPAAEEPQVVSLDAFRKRPPSKD